MWHQRPSTCFVQIAHVIVLMMALCCTVAPVHATCIPDTISPQLHVTPECTRWIFNASDTNRTTLETGIYDIWLADNNAADTTYNVAFDSVPTFAYGDSIVGPFAMHVIDPRLPAAASLHVRDGAGNEMDTLITYIPPKLTMTPQFLNAGGVAEHDTARVSAVLANGSSSPVTFNRMRLRYGAVHHWFVDTSLTPKVPFTIQASGQPGDSIVLHFFYVGPARGVMRFDDDTLFMTTCREFPMAVLWGMPMAPAGYAQTNFDFGDANAATQHGRGDTVSSARNVWITSIGTDTLHIVGARLVETFPKFDTTSAGGDFSVDSVTDLMTGEHLAFPPTPAAPWILPMLDSVFVNVRAHPHHTGACTAYLAFSTDANLEFNDTTFLSVYGLDASPVTDDRAAHPQDPSVVRTYPNPFSSVTSIRYVVRSDQHVTLRIRNEVGDVVATLVDGRQSLGIHRLDWRGDGLPCGAYAVEVIEGGVRATTWMVKTR